MYQHHHPLVLELSYDPAVWPDRTDVLWYRDIWERERFERIQSRSQGQEMDLQDGWVQAYQKQTYWNRLPAIISEIADLLSLFTNFRFFLYDSMQCWFIPLSGDARSSVWGQKGYTFITLIKPTEFTTPQGVQLPVVPYQKYYKQIRDGYYAGQDNQIELPSNIDNLFDTYFSLDTTKKIAFHAACHLYNQALELNNKMPSLALVASVMGIEALVNYDNSNGTTSCNECGAPESIEKCEVCGSPRYRATSNFKDFIGKYGSSDLNKFSDNLYKMRSKLAHGALLRDDEFDSGFYADNRDEQQMFRRASLIFVRLTMLNWLLVQSQAPLEAAQ